MDVNRGVVIGGATTVVGAGAGYGGLRMVRGAYRDMGGLHSLDALGKLSKHLVDTTDDSLLKKVPNAVKTVDLMGGVAKTTLADYTGAMARAPKFIGGGSLLAGGAAVSLLGVGMLANAAAFQSR